MRIIEFEWDEGNELHVGMGHGIDAEEAEEAFAVAPLFRKTKRGHYAVFGPTLAGRMLVVVFEYREGGVARVITGWDISSAERRCWNRSRRAR